MKVAIVGRRNVGKSTFVNTLAQAEQSRVGRTATVTEGRLNVHTTELPPNYTLNDVVCWFLAARGRREEAYVRLRSIIKDANFEPPQTLRRLAAITDFDLFVSTTCDSLLESAINLERFAGASSTDVLLEVTLRRKARFSGTRPRLSGRSSNVLTFFTRRSPPTET